MAHNLLQHLLDIESLDRETLSLLFNLASKVRADPAAFAGRLEGLVLINLFLEPSTRTRISFEIAAKRLGMHVINFNSESSSVVKGEALIDTFHTLQAMGPDVIAIRHVEDGVLTSLVDEAEAEVHIINAGEGNSRHPTQALLDAFTLQRARNDMGSLKITIAGDIRHSRVARSDIAILKKLGVAEIRLAGPAEMLPENPIEGVQQFHNLDAALQDVDVVMMLRIQRERFGAQTIPDPKTYFANWGLTRRRLLLAAPECLVMHPGPVNRNLEMADDVVACDQSLIGEQVRNGVYLRMAVLLSLF